MTIAFPDIISKLSNQEQIRSVNNHLKVTYQRVQLLTDQQSSIVPRTLYVGKASQVQPELQQFDDIGLILINDCQFDFSCLRGDAAECPPETNLTNLFNEVLDAFSASRRILDCSAALLNCLLEGKGLNDIIQIGSDILGKQISLVDYTGKQLAISNQQEIISGSLTPDGNPSQQIYSFFKNQNYTKQVNESPVPILLEIDHPEIPNMIVGKISINEKIVGHLAIIENEKKIGVEDIEIAKILSNVIAAEVQRNDYYLLMAGIHHEYFILDLIKEEHDNPITIEDRVRSLRWDAYKDYYVVIINIPRNDERFFFVEYFRRRLGEIFPFSKSIYFQENVILVIYRNCDLQNIIDNLDTILQENNLSAGISRRFSSIVDLKRHYEQARQALHIGRLLDSEQRVFLYDDQYLNDLLTILNRNANLKDFCHPGVDRILDHDKEYGTDYFKTLQEYMKNSANMTQVARNLHVHRNTLYNRIKKISEITELNLEEGDDILKLLLSFKIMDLCNINSELINNND